MFNKGIFRHRLFRTGPKDKKLSFWIWNWAWLLIAACGLSCLSLLLGLGDYPLCIACGYFTRPLIFLLNTLPIFILEAFLYFLINRSWIAFLSTGAVTLCASVGNYFKLLCRDDPFMFSDITAVGTALKVSGQYDISLDRRIFFCILCTLIGAAFLFFFVRGRMRTRPRLIAALVTLVLTLPVSRLYTSDVIYNHKTDNYQYANRWSSTQVYISKGFVYPFLHSVQSAFPEKPENYSAKSAEGILSSYTSSDIPSDRQVNVIAVQLEAFNDLRAIGFEDIDPGVYAAYDALKAESLNGRLVTNIFAGGTIDTERTFITGDTSLTDFRAPTGSYAWYLRNNGYYVTGSHSCYDWFYNRKNVNAYLGFEDYKFFENRYSDLADGAIAYDDILLPDIVTLYKERDPDVPYFDFSITYQGHGPYTTDGYDWGEGYWTGEGTAETDYILNNYLGSVQNTCENLLAMADSLRDDSAPVVLVFFGDHNPWLGYSNSVYNELGIDLDTSTEQGFMNYYCTPYLIWANDAAREIIGDISGDGVDVSPCFLMNILFDTLGWGQGSEYMQLMYELMDTGVTAINYSGMFIQHGELTGELTVDAAQALNRVQIAQYYRRTNPEW